MDLPGRSSVPEGAGRGCGARGVDMQGHSRCGDGGSARTQDCTLRCSPSAWQMQHKDGLSGRVPRVVQMGRQGMARSGERTSNARSPCATRPTFATRTG